MFRALRGKLYYYVDMYLKITFLGTRGYIKTKTRAHYRHTSTMIEYQKKRVMIDCGFDWAKKVWEIKPDAIVITHGHPDHAFGLMNGAPCPVYATQESFAIMKKYPIPLNNRHLMIPRKIKNICGIKFETFTVEHSILAPGVGYRITAGKFIIFCVHDIISIHDRRAALKDVQLYIGDGATINRPMVRRRGKQIFGHTTVRAQIGWCQQEHVPRMIVTHCGTQVVEGGRNAVNKIKSLGKEKEVNVLVARDGMGVIIAA